MAGSDTFRGASFQAAYAVGQALDVLEGKGEILVLEGTEDVTDAAVLGADREPISTVQAKTKIEPYSWAPGEIAAVLQSWLQTRPARAARFEFATDGSLGKGVVDDLLPAIRRLGEGALSREDRVYLKEKGLGPDDEALGRVALKSRLPGGRELLEQATLRFLAIYELVGRMRVEEARDVIARLFTATMLGSGDRDPVVREITRAEIADLVGVPLQTIDSAPGWSAEVESRYRQRLSELSLGPAWTMLDMLKAKPAPALALVRALAGDGQGARPADTLLDLGGDRSLVGPAGAGKTTTLAQLRAEALERGLLPVPMRLVSYDGRLEQALARALEGPARGPAGAGGAAGPPATR